MIYFILLLFIFYYNINCIEITPNVTDLQIKITEINVLSYINRISINGYIEYWENYEKDINIYNLTFYYTLLNRIIEDNEFIQTKSLLLLDNKFYLSTDDISAIYFSIGIIFNNYIICHTWINIVNLNENGTTCGDYYNPTPIPTIPIKKNYIWIIIVISISICILLLIISLSIYFLCKKSISRKSSRLSIKSSSSILI